MQPDDNTPPPDQHHPESRRPWGCSVAGLILMLLALFLVWDWYPVWSLSNRHEKLRQIAQPGELWTEVEPLLPKDGYLVSPADVTAAFGEDPTSAKLILISRRQPLLLQPIMSIALRTKRLDVMDYLSQLSIRQTAVIRLDNEGHIVSLEEGLRILGR